MSHTAVYKGEFVSFNDPIYFPITDSYADVVPFSELHIPHLNGIRYVLKVEKGIYSASGKQRNYHRFTVLNNAKEEVSEIEKDGWKLKYDTTYSGPDYDRVNYTFFDADGKEVETWQIADGTGFYLAKAIRRLNNLIHQRYLPTNPCDTAVEYSKSRYFEIERTHEFRGFKAPNTLENIFFTGTDVRYIMAVHEGSKTCTDGSVIPYNDYDFYNWYHERVSEIILNDWKLSIGLVPMEGHKISFTICDKDNCVKVKHVTEPNGEELAQMLNIMEKLSTGGITIEDGKSILERRETEKSKTKEVKQDIKRSELEAKINDYQHHLSELLRELALLDGPIVSTTLENDQYLEVLGRKSEEYLYNYLKSAHGEAHVEWINANGESFKPFDFILRDSEGDILKYIDCKGTHGSKANFYMSAKEWDFFLLNKEKYQVYRVFDISTKEPYFRCIENLFDSLHKGEVVPYSQFIEILDKEKILLSVKCV